MPIVIKIKKDSLCNDCLNVMDVTEEGYEGDYNYKMNGKYFKRKFFCIKLGGETNINYEKILKCNMHRPRKKRKKEE